VERELLGVEWPVFVATSALASEQLEQGREHLFIYCPDRQPLELHSLLLEPPREAPELAAEVG